MLLYHTSLFAAILRQPSDMGLRFVYGVVDEVPETGDVHRLGDPGILGFLVEVEFVAYGLASRQVTLHLHIDANVLRIEQARVDRVSHRARVVERR